MAAKSKKEKKLSKRQERMMEYIEECIASRRHPPSIREICDACDISSTSVADYNLRRLEEMGYIERQSNVSRGIQVKRAIGPLLRAEGKYNVPLYGSIAAGEPIFTPDNETPPEDYIEIARGLISPTNKELFALRVKGHSMIDALVDDGDIVILAHQETANNGDMVAAQVRDEEWTLKRIFKHGDKVELRPANPLMFKDEDIKTRFTFPAADVRITGKVCLVLRQV